MGGSDKEKDKKTMEKEKEEKKDKKEVWRSTIRHENCLSLKYQCYSLFSSFFGGGLEKEEGEKEIQQGEEKPPVL